ncbi:MAG: hypothetical protein EZS28_005872 [Streblomastix strix]|uniref:SPRY domain-containing protein n=1 Tax=Streblomastix strix TaxID=222440 RepID=A0A5J4WUN0_9EUKA|nr:MAG: hypothetical protein EZS28_005872 [Streblomastix strix]
MTQIPQQQAESSKMTQIPQQAESSKMIELPKQPDPQPPIKTWDVKFWITSTAGSYTKTKGEFTYLSTNDEGKTIAIDQQITRGIFRCEFRINELLDSQWFGVMKSTLKVPFGKDPSFQPYSKSCLIFLSDGRIWQNGNDAEGNEYMNTGDIIAIEVDMSAKPRTAKLFINNQLQPLYMSGIPESIQFFFFFYCKEESLTVLSLKRLEQPTPATVEDPEEIQWTKN